MMRLVLIGPPGVGKGTQARLLSLRKRITAIATGDMLRAAVESDTELGRRANDYMKKGELVPDEVMIAVVEERLSQTDTENGFLLDGFPRTVPQAVSLDGILERQGKALDAAVSLNSDESVIVERISGRLVCGNCGAVFHEKTNPPVSFGTCDVCHERLAVREDDQPNAVRRRLAVYREKTAPLEDHYLSASILHKVEAKGEIEQVYKAIEEALNPRCT